MCCRSRVLYSTAQIRRLGVKDLQTEDYVVTFGAAWYTVLCVAFNQMLQGAGSNLMTDEEVAALTPEITAERVLGSKWVFVTEHAMLLTIWSMKVALLLLYTRLTYVQPIPTPISFSNAHQTPDLDSPTKEGWSILSQSGRHAALLATYWRYI